MKTQGGNGCRAAQNTDYPTDRADPPKPPRGNGKTQKMRPARSATRLIRPALL